MLSSVMLAASPASAVMLAAAVMLAITGGVLVQARQARSRKPKIFLQPIMKTQVFRWMDFGRFGLNGVQEGGKEARTDYVSGAGKDIVFINSILRPHKVERSFSFCARVDRAPTVNF
eukprot:gene11172-18785_t